MAAEKSHDRKGSSVGNGQDGKNGQSDGAVVRDDIPKKRNKGNKGCKERWTTLS